MVGTSSRFLQMDLVGYSEERFKEILALRQPAGAGQFDGITYLAGWESEVDATTADVAEFIKKNA